MAGAEPQIDLQNFSIPPAGSLDMDDLIDLYESIRPWLPTPRPADTRRADRMLAGGMLKFCNSICGSAPAIYVSG